MLQIHIDWPNPESAIQDNTFGVQYQNYGYPGYENNIAQKD